MTFNSLETSITRSLHVDEQTKRKWECDA